MSTRKVVKLFTGLALLGGVVAAGIIYGPPLYARWNNDDAAMNGKQAAARFFAAKRGELKVLVTEEGKLRAIKNHSIFPQLLGSCKITWLATEGATVKKDDLLVTFDKKQFEDGLQTKKAELEAAKRELTVTEEALKIQEMTGKSTVKQA